MLWCSCVVGKKDNRRSTEKESDEEDEDGIECLILRLTMIFFSIILMLCCVDVVFMFEKMMNIRGERDVDDDVFNFDFLNYY